VDYAILRYERTGNLGDEIQSLAAAAVLPQVDLMIERDSLEGARPCTLVMNGWWMWPPYRFPPPDGVKPVIVGFHAGAGFRRIIRRSSQIQDWFAQHPPGVRDRATHEFFISLGIESTITNCLSLTLPRHDPPRTGGVVLADVPRRVEAALPADVSEGARRVTHRCQEPSHAARFRMARSLLDQYALARLVVTTRLHAALPCLAFGTPVVFLRAGSANFEPARLSALEGILPTYAVDGVTSIDFSAAAPNVAPIARACRAFVASRLAE